MALVIVYTTQNTIYTLNGTCNSLYHTEYDLYKHIAVLRLIDEEHKDTTLK